MEPSATLQELDRKMASLVAARNAAVAAAEAMIDQANAEFDRVALPLGREINKVRKAEEAKHVKENGGEKRAPKARANAKVLAGLEPDEQEYYRQLQAKRGT